MSVSEPRPHTAVRGRWADRLTWAAIVVCTVLFAGLTYFRVGSGDLNEVDTEQVHALSKAAAKPVTESAAYWPQWRGPNRDGVSPETGILSTWPDDGLKVLWTQKTGDGYSGVALAHGRAVTMVQDGEYEAVVCWDAVSGKELWRFKYPAHFVHRQFGDGPRSTPAIAGDYVYTVGGTGVMHCLTMTSGDAVWRKDLLDVFDASVLEWGIAFSPLVEKDRVYVMPGGRNGNALAALDCASGSIVWKNLDDTGSYSSPVAADLAGRRQIVALFAERLVGVAAESGELLWDVAWPSGPAHTPSSIATPLIIHRTSGDYVFIASGYDKGCALFKIQADGERCQAAQVYRNLNMRSVFSSPVCLGDFVYGFDDVNLTCLDVRNGKRKWKQFGFDKGSLIAADGRLIVLGANGTLALVAAEPQEYHELGQFQHAEVRCWTAPSLAEGRLYVRNRRQIVCYNLKK
jgi:outer membrane protein assembly factor BamB